MYLSVHPLIFQLFTINPLIYSTSIHPFIYGSIHSVNDTATAATLVEKNVFHSGLKWTVQSGVQLWQRVAMLTDDGNKAVGKCKEGEEKTKQKEKVALPGGVPCRAQCDRKWTTTQCWVQISSRAARWVNKEQYPASQNMKFHNMKGIIV